VRNSINFSIQRYHQHIMEVCCSSHRWHWLSLDSTETRWCQRV